MTVNQQAVALYTLVRRETVRMLRIASQVFLPPVITTALYFLIFGTLIGHRIGPIDSISYPLFIAPGLIIMTVITNAYGNVSTSLFSLRFQKSIEEILVSPMHNGLLLLGYVLGGIIRGFIVAILVFLVAAYFVDIRIVHIGMTLLIVLLVSALFSLAGFTNAMLARNFDDVMLVPTFILAPLTYLGGVFYSTDMLPSFWQMMSHLNPIFYMVNAMRYAITGHGESNIYLSMIVICAIVFILIYINTVLLHKGVGLRD
jgi:ABC-2 type transport system permease protein